MQRSQKITFYSFDAASMRLSNMKAALAYLFTLFTPASARVNARQKAWVGARFYEVQQCWTPAIQPITTVKFSRVTSGPRDFRSAWLPVRVTSGPRDFRSTWLPVHVTSGPRDFRSTWLPVHVTSGPRDFRSTWLPVHVTSGPRDFRSTWLPVLSLWATKSLQAGVVDYLRTLRFDNTARCWRELTGLHWYSGCGWACL